MKKIYESLAFFVYLAPPLAPLGGRAMDFSILIPLAIEMLHTKLKMATIMELWYKWYTAFHWHWTNSISDFFLSYKLSLKCQLEQKQAYNWCSFLKFVFSNTPIWYQKNTWLSQFTPQRWINLKETYKFVSWSS